MPSNPIPAPVQYVMPSGLMQLFEFERRYEVLYNEYPDGNSNRVTLSILPRHFAKVSRRLTLAQYTDLRSFYTAIQLQPFYFYNLRETVPIGAFDPTGANTVGRYTMVFDAPWSEEVMLGRSNVNLAMREVH